MSMAIMQIEEKEYKELRAKADIDEDLLKSLIRGLEDVKSGKVKPWKKTIA